jgi:hypothetical protein
VAGLQDSKNSVKNDKTITKGRNVFIALRFFRLRKFQSASVADFMINTGQKTWFAVIQGVSKHYLNGGLSFLNPPFQFKM